GDRRQLPEIALQIRLHVTGEPGGPRITRVQLERGYRVPAAPGEHLPILSRDPLRRNQVRPLVVLRLEQFLPDAGASHAQFAHAASWARASDRSRGRRLSPKPDSSAADNGGSPRTGRFRQLDLDAAQLTFSGANE